MSPEIINRVAKSPLVEIDLEKYYPKGKRIVYDLKDNLYKGLILKEKELRNFLKTNHWESYKGKHVALVCSVDAVIPVWAYLLLTTYLTPYADTIVYGSLEVLEYALFHKTIEKIDIQSFKNKKIIIKGCSHLPIPESAFVELIGKLQPVVSSLMYGEACSNVPIFKRKNKK